MAEKFNFPLDGWDTALIDVEEFIAALGRAKYPNTDSSPTAEVLRFSVEATVKNGGLRPFDGGMVPLNGIPARKLNEPFSGLFFEREEFFAFVREAWLEGEPDEALAAQDEAQHITVEDIAHMIAIQRTDQSMNIEDIPDGRESVHRSIELARQLMGWHTDGIPGVIPQIVEMVRTRTITPSPVETGLPVVSDLRASPGLWSLTAEDAQRVLASLCPGVRRYTISDVADIIARRSYPRDMTKAREAECALVERIEDAIEQGELTANERRKDGEILLNEHGIDEWLIREQIPVLLNPTTKANVEQAAMKDAGRLTIDDVVGILAKETSTEAARWESTLVAEIRGGALTLKNPRDLGDFLPYAVPKSLRTFYDRVDVADVNKLLGAHPEWRIEYRFETATLPRWETSTAPMRTVTHSGDKWLDAELRTLLTESKLPDFTQKKAGEKYKVSRARIGALLKQAKDKFETPAKSSVFQTFGTQNRRKVKGTQY
ncbi:ElaB/YqjD/DUF883 family membrane-anchored ribosome-binding protein [Paraburkholderia sp. Clong3]|uniref:hypothetical protein n=1 Tax=Paraburkholderia sp. Clong3 TaxID=2991061 RepID=UPI003D1F101A